MRRRGGGIEENLKWISSLQFERGQHLQYIPNTPKKPNIPRATNSNLTSFFPNGKSSTFFHHMYHDESTTVIVIRANRIWNGCIPLPLFPSTSSNLVVTFISMPKNCASSTSASPLFLIQNAFSLLLIVGGDVGDCDGCLSMATGLRSKGRLIRAASPSSIENSDSVSGDRERRMDSRFGTFRRSFQPDSFADVACAVEDLSLELALQRTSSTTELIFEHCNCKPRPYKKELRRALTRA